MLEFLALLFALAVLGLFLHFAHKAHANFLYYVLFLFLLLGLVLFVGISTEKGVKRSILGMPITEIAAGIYQVGFVYEAGERVSVGIERETGEVKIKSTRQGTEEVTKYSYKQLFFYQFPKSAFAGEVKKNATRLAVTEGGGFKKLELQ